MQRDLAHPSANTGPTERGNIRPFLLSIRNVDSENEASSPSSYAARSDPLLSLIGMVECETGGVSKDT